MTMPAPREMADLGPRIGIQNVMACWPYAAIQQQAPVIDQIRAHAYEVVGQFVIPPGVAHAAICRLVDADDKMIGRCSGQMHGRQTDPATGVEDQWPLAIGAPSRNAGKECRSIVFGHRLPEWMAAMPCNKHSQLSMRTSLVAGDRRRIRVHRARA